MKKEHLEKAIQLRHELHMHPELSGQEKRTRGRLMDFLRNNTDLQVIDKGSWFYAWYTSGADRPGIAFRADFDALPIKDEITASHTSKNQGVGHKCGHDGHAATLAALALEVNDRGAERDVFCIFQHAEETGAGAQECTVIFNEHEIDEIYAYHNMPGLPKGAVALKAGPMHFASKGLSMYFKGKESHASMPEEGINPSYAIAHVIEMIEYLPKHGDYNGLVLCSIVQVDIGKLAFGTSAGHGVLRITIRAQFEADLNLLQTAIENRAREEAAKAGLSYSSEESDVFSEVINHKESVQKVRTVCESLKIPVIELQEAFRASEDFGLFLKKCKGCIFFIGAGETAPQLHDPAFDFPDDIIETAVDIFKGLISHNSV